MGQTCTVMEGGEIDRGVNASIVQKSLKACSAALAEQRMRPDDAPESSPGKLWVEEVSEDEFDLPPTEEGRSLLHGSGDLLTSSKKEPALKMPLPSAGSELLKVCFDDYLRDSKLPSLSSLKDDQVWATSDAASPPTSTPVAAAAAAAARATEAATADESAEPGGEERQRSEASTRSDDVAAARPQDPGTCARALSSASTAADSSVHLSERPQQSQQQSQQQQQQQQQPRSQSRWQSQVAVDRARTDGAAVAPRTAAAAASALDVPWWEHDMEGSDMTDDSDEAVVANEGEPEGSASLGCEHYLEAWVGPFPASDDDVSTVSPDGHCTERGGYTGQLAGVLRHGVGRQTWPDGSEYVGEWREDLPTGRGCFTCYDGSSYIGEWKGGKAHGLGTFYSATGSKYTGAWSDNASHGHGLEQWASGQRFEGHYIGGERQGHGIFHLTDGTSLRGHWLSRGQGIGVFGGESDPIFRGRWSISSRETCQPIGVGESSVEEGQLYQGEFLAGTRHGFGSHRWADGRHYEGYWSGGVPNGWGWYQSSANTVYQLSYWKDGQKIPRDVYLKAKQPKSLPSLDGCSTELVCSAFPR